MASNSGYCYAQRLGNFHFGAFQDADQLQSVDDTFALVVVVGDDEDFAGALGDFGDALGPRRELFGGIKIVVALVGRHGRIVGEPGVVAAAVQPHIADRGRGFGARFDASDRSRADRCCRIQRSILQAEQKFPASCQEAWRTSTTNG